MGESTQTGYSRPLMRNQDKTMTQAFQLEADNIPVTFPRKCQGLDKFIWLAGDTAQETRWGVWGRGGGPPFPSYAKECHCERCKSSDKLFLPPWSARRVEFAAVLSPPPDAVGRFNQMLSQMYSQIRQDVDTEASLNALFVRFARLVLAS